MTVTRLSRDGWKGNHRELEPLGCRMDDGKLESMTQRYEDRILTPVDDSSVVLSERFVGITSLGEGDGRNTLGNSPGVVGDSHIASSSNCRGE